jgi:predicted kinase
VVSVDPLEAGIVAAGIEPSFVAEQQLAAGRSVVVDAANYLEEGRDIWRALAARTGAELRIIVVELDDAERASRLAARDRGSAIREPTPAFLAEQRDAWRPWREPHLTLDGSAPVEQNLDRVLGFLR